MPEKVKNPEREIRSFTVELKTKKRQDGDGSPLPMIEGYAAVFNSRSENLGGRYWEFYEEILPGAFTEAIREDDIVANFNHNSDYVLGRNTSQPEPTLTLREDEKGLFVEIDTPDTSYARDLVRSIERGDIKGMSFAFTLVDSYWRVEDEKEILYVEKAKLYDVSVVTHPAYRETSVGLRALMQERMESVMQTSQERAEKAKDSLAAFKADEEKRQDADGGDALPVDKGSEAKPEEERETKPAGDGTAVPPEDKETRDNGSEAKPGENQDPKGVEPSPANKRETSPEDESWKADLTLRKRKLELLELSA